EGLSAALASIGQPGGPDLPTRAANLLRDLNQTLDTLRKLAEGAPLTEFFDRALEESGYASLFTTGDPDMVERWENLMQLRATLEPFDLVEDTNRLHLFLEE